MSETHQAGPKKGKPKHKLETLLGAKPKAVRLSARELGIDLSQFDMGHAS